MRIPILSNVYTFLRKTVQELKKVSWISRQETVSYTVTVIFFLILGVIFIMGADTVFTEVRSEILLQNF